MKHNSFASGVLSIVSRSDYDDMPSGGGGRRGKGNKGLTLGVLICILVVLIIVVVRLIFAPNEKLEVLPPTVVEKENSQSVSSSTNENNEELEIAEIEIPIVLEEEVSEDEALSEVDATREEVMEIVIEDSSTDTEPSEILNTDNSLISEDSNLSESITIDEPIEELVTEEVEIPEESQSVREENANYETIPDTIYEENNSPIYSDEYTSQTLDTIDEEKEDTIVIEKEERLGDDERQSVSLSPSSEESSVEEIVEVPPLVAKEVVENKVEEPIEEDESAIVIEPEPYDPFIREDVLSLRKSLDDLLSRINFDFILNDEEDNEKANEVVEQALDEEKEEVDFNTPDMIPEEGIVLEIEEVPEKQEILEETEIEETTSPLNNDHRDVIVDEVKEDKATLISEKSNEILNGSSINTENNRVILTSTPGSAVKSPVKGIVVESKRIDGEKTISIEAENGDIWRFSGFERVSVKLDNEIKEGSVLGSIGSSSGSSISIWIFDEEDI